MRNYFFFSKYSCYLVRRCTRKKFSSQGKLMSNVGCVLWYMEFFTIFSFLLCLKSDNNITSYKYVYRQGQYIFPDMSVNRGCMHFIFEWEIWTKDYYWVCLYIYGISFFLILNSCLISAFSAINVIWSLKPKGQL